MTISQDGCYSDLHLQTLPEELDMEWRDEHMVIDAIVKKAKQIEA